MGGRGEREIGVRVMVEVGRWKTGWKCMTLLR